MIIKTLEIHNIASIEEAFIDFESSPLGDSEVFLISGNTGAGKSTILDAICLALYATTPRFKNSTMEGCLPEEGEDISVDDSRQFLRRNTSEGWVKLCYKGINEKDYEAYWGVKEIKRRKTDGKKKNEIWELKCIAPYEIITKKTEIRKEIEKSVGLDFTQFCRTTMLAQGEFSKFLHSSDKDKAAILEKITGRTDFADIGKNIFDTTVQKKREMETEEIKMGGIKLLDDEKCQEIKQELIQLENLYQTLGLSLEKLNKTLEWHKRKEELEKNLESAKEVLKDANAKKESDEFVESKNLVKVWQITREARRNLEENEKINRELEDIDSKLDKLQTDYCEYHAGLIFYKKTKSRLVNEIDEISKELQTLGAKLEFKEGLDQILIHLDSLSEMLLNKKETENKLCSVEKKIEKDLKPRKGLADTELIENEKLLNEKREEIKRKETLLTTYGLTSLREKLELLRRKETNLLLIKEKKNNIEKTKASAEILTGNLEKIREEIKGIFSDLTGLTENIKEAEDKYSKAKNEFEIRKETIEDFVKSMRSGLKMGQTCPVCLQPVTDTHFSEDEIAKKVEKYRLKKEECEAVLNELRLKENKTSARINSLQHSYINTLQLKIKEQERIEELERELIKMVYEIFDHEAENLEISIENEQTNLKEEECKILISIKDGEIIETDLKELRNDEIRISAVHDKKIKIKNDAELLLIQALKESEYLSNYKKELSLKIDRITESLLPELKVKFNIDTIEDPKIYSLQLKKESDLYNKKESSRMTLEKELFAIEISIRDNEETERRLLTLHNFERNIADTQGDYEIEGLTKKFTDLLSAVSDLSGKRRTLKETEERNNRELESFYSTTPDITPRLLKEMNCIRPEVIEAKEEEIKSIEKSAEEYEIKLRQYEREMSIHLENEDLEMQDLNTQTLQEKKRQIENEIKEASEKRGSLNNILAINQENKERLNLILKEFEKKKEIYNNWERLNRLFGDREGSKFRRIAQSYVLADLINTANHYMATLSRRYRLHVNPGSYVISITDAWQGFTSRSASTLSGGETFLVSLALALALSDFGNRLAVNTLFIDEGFGTLSGEALHNAIETLRSLHNTSGRHVGIISHVEELKEKIPVQIKVEQEGTNGAGKVTVV